MDSEQVLLCVQSPLVNQSGIITNMYVHLSYLFSLHLVSFPNASIPFHCRNLKSSFIETTPPQPQVIEHTLIFSMILFLHIILIDIGDDDAHYIAGPGFMEPVAGSSMQLQIVKALRSGDRKKASHLLRDFGRRGHSLSVNDFVDIFKYCAQSPDPMVCQLRR